MQSCVPARQFQELEEKYGKCETDRDELSAFNNDLETKNTELKADIDRLNEERGTLTRDTTTLGESLRKTRSQYNKINDLNDQLLEKQSKLQAGSDRENRKLIEQLQGLKSVLQDKEDRLDVTERQLSAKERELEEKQANLDKVQQALEAREARVNELEEIIAQKDAAVMSLKDKISQALMGFKDKGMMQPSKPKPGMQQHLPLVPVAILERDTMDNPWMISTNTRQFLV